MLYGNTCKMGRFKHKQLCHQVTHLVDMKAKILLHQHVPPAVFLSLGILTKIKQYSKNILCGPLSLGNARSDEVKQVHSTGLLRIS